MCLLENFFFLIYFLLYLLYGLLNQHIGPDITVSWANTWCLEHSGKIKESGILPL